MKKHIKNEIQIKVVTKNKTVRNVVIKRKSSNTIFRGRIGEGEEREAELLFEYSLF